ncbi:MAG: hypothetical protein KGN76_14485 [Acidobacteriota bacterium]|nr:hypothetical protein [Acidobacteriota bacterium]
MMLRRTRSLRTLAAAVLLACGCAAAGAAAPAPAVRTFRITARRFAFEPARIVVAQGDTVRLTLVSADVTHGFTIDRYGIDVTIPAGGSPVTVEFVARLAGDFPIGCSVYCGTGHEDMHAVLSVEPAGGTAGPPPAPAAAAINPTDVADRTFKPSEPDYTLVDLPTTLRLPRFGSAVRITHRFARALNDGSFGSLASSLFGLDAGAQIGLEYRFGIARGAQIGFHRTSDRTIELFGQYDLLRRATPGPIALDALVSVEGLDNFRRSHSPALGVIVSRRLGTHGAVYAMPIWVGGTDLQAPGGQRRQTFFVGLGARLRVRPTVYVVGELSPRAGGYAPGDAATSLAIEKHVGGHVFQLNVSNTIGTTLGQIARGGPAGHHWSLGFNITRKLF